VKKHSAAYRFSDGKVIPLFANGVPGGALVGTYTPASDATRYFKRMIDLVFSLSILVFGLPFYALIAALIKLTSEGPVLFVQERVGKDGRPFRFYKFRTMTVDSTDNRHRDFAENFIKGKVMELRDEAGRPVYKIPHDPRVTSIGQFLRRTSLDELPQFINVLKGEMSLVGPRPPLTYEYSYYKEWHKARLVVRPGLTGLWQVSGRSTVPFDEMVMLDLYYIDNWSLALDLKIVFRTLPVMLFGYGGY